MVKQMIETPVTSSFDAAQRLRAQLPMADAALAWGVDASALTGTDANGASTGSFTWSPPT